MVGYDYPLLGFFWSMLIIFLWIAWLFLLFRVIFDIFRNHDTGGVSKAIWLLFVIIVPFLGVLVYVIAHGGKMAQRDVQPAQAQQQQFDAYVRQTAGTSSTADELSRLAAY